ncbi:MAG: helix-turn-helix domain-containing protein [Gemmatimonadota bacterium]
MSARGSAAPPARGTAYLVVHDEALRRRILTALSTLNVRVKLLAAVGDIPRVQPDRTDRVLIVDAPNAHTLPLLHAIASLRAADRATPIVLCIAPGGPVGALPEFARSHVDGLVLGSFVGFEQEVRELVDQHLDHALPSATLESVLFGRTEHVRYERWWIARRSWRKSRGREFADWHGVDPNTLRSRHEDDGGLTPYTWHRWCRLLHVAHALDETALSLTAIAKRLDFTSPADMSMFVYRMTGEYPSVLRTAGATRRVLDVWKRVQLLEVDFAD